MIFLIILVIAVVMLLAYALCNSAKRGDEIIEHLERDTYHCGIDSKQH